MTFRKDFVKIRFSFHPEMALFALLGVLREFSGCGVQAYASPQTLVRPLTVQKLLISELDTN